MKPLQAMAFVLALCVGLQLSAGSALDPALQKPIGLKAPDESKTLETSVLPSPTMPELIFKNQAGKEIRLSDCFDGKRPVVLNMVYLGCPRLCTEVLNGAVDSLQKLSLTAGEDYRILTVSFDPREGGKGYALAASKRQSYLEDFAKDDVHGPRKLKPDAWTLLVERHSGEIHDKGDAHKLAQALDFNYMYNDKKDMYEHPSMTIVLTPDGKISRYLYGTKYQAKNMKLAIMEASEGKVGSSVEKLISWCYRYDPSSNGFTPNVLKLLSVAAGVSLLIFGGFMFKMWRNEFRRGSVK